MLPLFCLVQAFPTVNFLLRAALVRPLSSGMLYTHLDFFFEPGSCSFVQDRVVQSPRLCECSSFLVGIYFWSHATVV